ncbi:MAG: SPASM domain-containing protein [Caldisericia bacterium]|nr:SPASM domain-containing protein [Caldisericia bacterium]
MGGEPLLPIHDKVVLHFIDVVKAYNGKLQIITNGTFFNDYSEKFKDLNTVIQIKLDGPPEINTFRRPNKKSSNYMFNNILLSIENYLKIGLSVCVRVNVDWHNINFIPGLVEILSKFEKYNGKFEIYFYPVSEGTSSWSKYFITEIEYATEMSKLSMDFPKLLEYNWSLHGCNQIYAHFLDKQSVGPSFSFCSASGNQFVFAPDGKVYSCWWGIGKKDFQIGLYFPTTRINDTLVKKWGSRTIINKQLRCYSCRFVFICGGSCIYKAWEAFGDIFATKCPLIEDLINIYVKALYR